MTSHIHFICSGNIYRSRIAEAYLKSKKLPNITVSSSGTQAHRQGKGSIAWYALRLLYRHNLLPYMSNMWRVTREEYLSEADIVVFMGKSNWEFCQKWLPEGKKYEIWEVPDFDDKEDNQKPLNVKKEITYIEMSEDAFRKIVENVDRLVVSYKLDASRNK